MSEDIERLSELMQGLYVQRMRMAFPSYRLNRDKQARHFDRAAKVVLDNNWDAERFIALQFEKRSTGYPFPNQLYSDLAQDIYKKASEADMDKRAKIRLELEIQAFRFASDRNDTLLETLEDVTEDFTVIFKYCAARMAADCKLADRYKEDARLYVRIHPYCKEVYGQVCPEVLDW